MDLTKYEMETIYNYNKDFMNICKDLICNAIKPYNYGWRHDDRFDVVEEGDNSEQE